MDRKERVYTIYICHSDMQAIHKITGLSFMHCAATYPTKTYYIIASNISPLAGKGASKNFSACLSRGTLAMASQFENFVPVHYTELVATGNEKKINKYQLLLNLYSHWFQFFALSC